MNFIIIAALVYCCGAISADTKKPKIKLNLEDVYKPYIKNLINNPNISNDKKFDAIIDALKERHDHGKTTQQQLIDIMAFESAEKNYKISQLSKQLDDKEETIKRLMAANKEEQQRASSNRMQNVALFTIALGIGAYVVHTILRNQPSTTAFSNDYFNARSKL